VTAWSLRVGEGEVGGSELEVEYDGLSHSAAGFAHLCIANWRKFLREKKLLK
jgi:hypothetical protein